MNKKSLQLENIGKIKVIEYLKKSKVFLVKSQDDIINKINRKLNKGQYDNIGNNVIRVIIDLSSDGLVYLTFLINTYWVSSTKKILTRNNIKYNHMYKTTEIEINCLIANFKHCPAVILFDENTKSYSLFNTIDESIEDVIKKSDKIMILK